MKTSVVVVSYRPGAWLAECLRSAAEQADEVVLVDNGSAGAIASAVGRDAGAVVLRLPVNQGFASAVNAGARRATGDVLALLNDDAVALPGWLSLAAAVLADSKVAAVGPKIVFEAPFRQVVLPEDCWYAPGDYRPLGRQLRSVTVAGRQLLAAVTGPGVHRLEGDGDKTWRWSAGSKPWYVPLPAGNESAEVLLDGEPAPPGPVVRLVNSAGAYLDTRGYAGNIGAGAPDDGRFDFAEPVERFALSGAAWATRMETWHRLGPFAARYFAYYEDIDWCWRARLAGMRLVYDSRTTVRHIGSASFGGEHEPSVRVMAERNRTLTMVRNGPVRLAAKALLDRARNGPDGGVRAGVARLVPWASATRLYMSRTWQNKPEEVWGTWAGRDLSWDEAPAGPKAFVVQG
jgi:N-acetylglucosaminyl-diphospho-decaprenol L-rhamnosyltransferase